MKISRPATPKPVDRVIVTQIVGGLAVRVKVTDPRGAFDVAPSSQRLVSAGSLFPAADLNRPVVAVVGGTLCAAATESTLSIIGDAHTRPPAAIPLRSRLRR
jgi:hypothetical protein